MITERINTKHGTDFDFRDIEIILNRNLPTNNKEIVDNWLKLRGLVSDKTVIDHLPYDLDAESELAEMEEQNEEAIERQMEIMSKAGDNNVGIPKQENETAQEDIRQEESNDAKQDTRGLQST